MAATWVLGLGSNLGERLELLRRAAAGLHGGGVRVTAKSSVYETPPLGPEQPDFLNAAVAVETELSSRELLHHALAVERALGRARPDPVRWGPRRIDIDLLWCSAGVVEEAGLVVPHPGLPERSFALVPLCEIAPDACDPRTGVRYADVAAARALLARVASL
jgi:2-amino-4-hydroxy-6-hydroxymethyldihydropteridine diphosphokinase